MGPTSGGLATIKLQLSQTAAAAAGEDVHLVKFGHEFQPATGLSMKRIIITETFHLFISYLPDSIHFFFGLLSQARFRYSKQTALCCP